MFIYLRRNDSFYFVRNMFMIAMAIALVGYAAVPDGAAAADARVGLHRLDLAVPRRHRRSTTAPAKAFINFYAAVPSMHVCFAIMIGWPMARLVAPAPAQDRCGAVPAVHHVRRRRDRQPLPHRRRSSARSPPASSALLAKRLLARARPDAWAFGQATA